MAPHNVLVYAGGVFCLAPLAVYLGWLAAVNRRDRPTVVAGPWDFVALLAGLLGFVVVGGGITLALLESNARFAGRGDWEQVRMAWGRERVAWVAVAGAYVAAVGVATGLGLAVRSKTLAVYNADRGEIEAVINAAFAAIGVPARRSGDVWAVPGGDDLVAVDSFAAFCHVTVKLLADDPRVAEEIERQLRARVPALPGADNPAGSWFTSASVTATVVFVALTGLITYSANAR